MPRTEVTTVSTPSTYSPPPVNEDPYPPEPECQDCGYLCICKPEEPEGDEQVVEVTGLLQIDGSVVVFSGKLNGENIRFATDRRPGLDIVEALFDKDRDPNEPVRAFVPFWAHI